MPPGWHGWAQRHPASERFVDSDHWSGRMRAGFAAEVAGDRGPVYLKLSHLPEESVAALEPIRDTTDVAKALGTRRADAVPGSALDVLSGEVVDG